MDLEHWITIKRNCKGKGVNSIEQTGMELPQLLELLTIIDDLKYSLQIAVQYTDLPVSLRAQMVDLLNKYFSKRR